MFLNSVYTLLNCIRTAKQSRRIKYELLPAGLLHQFRLVRKDVRGFTIIELLVYMGIFTILIATLTEIFFSILDARRESDATSNVEQNGRYILSRLFYDIKRSQSISTPTAPGQQSSTLQLVINGITYSYAPDGNGNLQITYNPGTGSLTDNLTGYDASISSVNFKRLGNSGGKNTIQVNFTLSSKTIRKSGVEIRNYQTSIGTR